MGFYKSRPLRPSQTRSIELVTFESIPRISAHAVIRETLLGHGTYGRVYKGRWEEQDVAIKEIKGNAILMRPFLEKEIRILSQCRGSPYIPQLLAIVIDDGYQWFLMELCTGGDLFEYIPSLVHPAELQALFADTAKALTWLHNRRIVHRDIKPDNIFLHQKTDTRRTRALLGDMGLATELPMSGLLVKPCGTHGYLAPEMLTGYPYDEKADVYSFGVAAQRVYKHRKWVVPQWAFVCTSIDPTDRPDLDALEIQPMCKDGPACVHGECCWFAHPSSAPSTTESTDAGVPNTKPRLSKRW